MLIWKHLLKKDGQNVKIKEKPMADGGSRMQNDDLRQRIHLQMKENEKRRNALEDEHFFLINERELHEKTA